MANLGHLEAAVMGSLWSADEPMSVRDVLNRLNQDRELAYTTVMTVLDNLYRKEMVRREKSGRAWVYLPTATRSSYTAELMEQALDSSPDRGSVLLRFVEQLPVSEVEQLRRVLDSSVAPKNATNPKGARPNRQRRR